MQNETFLFVTMGELCRTPVVTCSREEDLVRVAARMRDRNISGIVVCAGGRPVGVITDRDYRNLVADADGDLRQRRADEIMSTPLVTVEEGEPVFEAIYRMSKHNIHRLIVVDGEGRLRGIVTDTDVIGLHASTPLYFRRDVDSADSLEELRQVNDGMQRMVSFASRAGASTRDVVRLISEFNDAVTQRLVALLARDEGVRMPPGAAYLALGSEGRREQTLRTDIDSAAVYADGLSATEVAEVERFSTRLVEGLVAIGVRPCPGNTMASNPEWRHPLSRWKGILEHWVAVPDAENMVNFGMFQDLRTLWGDPDLEQELKEGLVELVRRHSLFLPRLARNIVRFKPPLGLFRRLKVERSGEHKGTINVKKAGIFALTEGVSLLALEAGVLDGSTWEKLGALRDRGVIRGEEADRLEEAFSRLVGLRLRNQLRDLAEGEEPSNYLDPRGLTLGERETLKASLEAVKGLLRLLRERYQLDFLAP